MSVGLDLGQAQDYTAMAVVKRLNPELAWEFYGHDDPDSFIYELKYLKRWPLGTSYPQIVDDVVQMANHRALLDRSKWMIDTTGVGTPIADQLFEIGLDAVPILITSGRRSNRNKRTLCVPKRDLIATVSVFLQNGMLKFPSDIELRNEFIAELTNFTMRISRTGQDTYSPLQHSQHDDLVMALALACYYHERRRRLAPRRINLRVHSR
jgi:hypothetical protein